MASWRCTTRQKFSLGIFYAAVWACNSTGGIADTTPTTNALFETPPECIRYSKELYSHIWSDFAPLAAHGPITTSNVSDLLALTRKWTGWQYYFLEIAVVAGKVHYRKTKMGIGPWQEAALKLLALTVQKHPDHVPDVYFILSVLDDPYLQRTSKKPLPLLSQMTARSHWDIPVPSYTYFESTGGISSDHLGSDFQTWEKTDWQEHLAERYPLEKRGTRAFFRGHDWASSNSLIEMLPSRGTDACITSDEVTRAFSYRRWYADQSAPGAALEGQLDVDLTGAPSFVHDANRKYAAPVSIPDHAAHKYLLHLDGTTISNRLLKLLTLGSVVLKQDSIYEEAFYRVLQPYVHFVPFERDRCSSANLTATLSWLQSHDALAREIALAGQKLTREVLSTHAATCYWQRVLAIYASLQTFDPRLAIRISQFTEFQFSTSTD